jgi:hypothetical protein
MAVAGGICQFELVKAKKGGAESRGTWIGEEEEDRGFEGEWRCLKKYQPTQQASFPIHLKGTKKPVYYVWTQQT